VPVIPRASFTPEWIPDSIVVAVTVAVTTAIFAALWWNLVRRAARRRRAELAFWSTLLVAVVVALDAAEQVVLPTRSRQKKFTMRFQRAAEDHYVGQAHFDFFWEESFFTGRQLGRVVRVTRHVVSPRATTRCKLCNVVDDRWQRTRLPVPHVTIMLVDVHRELRTEELVDDLWAYCDAPDNEETGRALWNTIRKSRLTLERQELTEVVTRFN
jgi:hypothetical protein